jgi:hypothetical protein
MNSELLCSELLCDAAMAVAGIGGLFLVTAGWFGL